MAPPEIAPRIISKEASTYVKDDSDYRILVGTTFKYVTVLAGTLDVASIVTMPVNFQSILPPLPYYEDGWNTACISRNAASGELEAALSQIELPGVQNIWHPEMVNCLDLEKIEQRGLVAYECAWKPDAAAGSPSTSEPQDQQQSSRRQRTMLAIMAAFPYGIEGVEDETRIHQLLQNTGIAPKFLGHIHEEGRVTGFLLEKPEGRPACIDDLEVCAAALRRLHGLGILYGDCNRHNFVVGPDGAVTLVDFDAAEVAADGERMEREDTGLAKELRDESGPYIGEWFLLV